MSIEGQGHFFTIYFPGFLCFVLFLANISGERLQDHWSSGMQFKFDNNKKREVLPCNRGGGGVLTDTHPLKTKK